MDESTSIPNDLLSAAGQKPEPAERRESGSNRVKRDRRKGVKRTVGLELSPDSISLAIVEQTGNDGARRLVTRNIPFAEESGPARGDWSDGTLTRELLKLADEFHLSGHAVTVGLGGSPCVTRVVMGENEDVDHDVRELTERSRRYIGLGRGEKVNCHSETRLDAKRKRVWITVANRSVVDAIADAISEAGMRLSRLEHTMVVLCRVLSATGQDRDEPVLLVSDENGRFELGISYRGQLLLDYRPAIADEEESHSVLVERHIKCLRRYLQSRLQGVTSELSKVFVTAANPANAKASTKLSDDSDLRVVDFPTAALADGIEVIDGEISEDPGMMSAIWLARNEELDSHSVAPNDLMKTLRPSSDIPWRSVIKLSWPIAAVAAAVFLLMTSTQFERHSIAAVEKQIEELVPMRAEAGRLRFALEQTTHFDRNVSSLSAQIHAPRWNKILYQSGALLPQGAWLETVRIDHQPKVSLYGTSFTDDAIYDYIGRLKESGLFSRVSLESTNAIKIQNGPAFRFEITADVRGRAKPTRAAGKLAVTATGRGQNG